jgi:hypothetical protein
MINQRNNICKACKNDIVVENLNCSIFSATKAASFSCDVDSNNFLFAKVSWIRFASFSFEIDRFFRYWLKTSKDIFFSFLLILSFWYSRLFSMIETTLHRFLIRSTRKSFKTKSITKDSKQKRFVFFFFFFSISTTSTQNLFNDERFELFVSQRFETSFFMTIFSSKNFISSFWTISLLFELRTTDDHSTDSETEKTKANKLSTNEARKRQADEHEVKTTFFSTSDSFLLIEKNDTNDWFSFERFSKVEETTRNTTNSNTENRERIKVESQNSQFEWTFSSTENSAKKQTTHTNFSLKHFSILDFEIFSQSSSFNDETEAKNSTKQINKMSKFSKWLT